MKLRVYLDNCCFNRPFDDQTYFIIKLETEAKLLIQKEINDGNIDLVWSFILHYENNDNPYYDRKEQIKLWEKISKETVLFNQNILEKSKEIMTLDIKEKDALHLACALSANSDCFITTDKKILNKNLEGIDILNPIDFVRRYYSENRNVPQT